jgi:hypothetical protein
MKILAHSESHIVKLSDGSVWQIFPGDIDLTLGWLPTTELQLFDINDHIVSHGLINCDDGTVVRVRPPGEQWPEAGQDPAQRGLRNGSHVAQQLHFKLPAVRQNIDPCFELHGQTGRAAVLERSVAVTASSPNRLASSFWSHARRTAGAASHVRRVETHEAQERQGEDVGHL